jgi:hypothetical protein
MTAFPEVTRNIVGQFGIVALLIRRRCRAAKIHTPPSA